MARPTHERAGFLDSMYARAMAQVEERPLEARAIAGIIRSVQEGLKEAQDFTPHAEKLKLAAEDGIYNKYPQFESLNPQDFHLKGTTGEGQVWIEVSHNCDELAIRGLLEADWIQEVPLYIDRPSSTYTEVDRVIDAGLARNPHWADIVYYD